MNYSEIRLNARKALRGKWGVAVLAGIIVSMLPAVADGAFMMLGLLSILGTIAYFMVLGPLEYSYNRMMLRANRGEKIEVGDSFYGFNDFSRTMMAGIDIYVRTFLWALLLIIPGIVASYSYSMTYYIMNDNPSLTGSEAIKKSKEMMNGHKWELFFLDLSFIGWLLLCIVTLGIASLWVSPYMAAARANFYQKLTNEYYGNDARQEDEKKVVSEGDVKPYTESEDASVIYNLKCPSCGARETHNHKTMRCPYCEAAMKEDN